MKVLISDPLCPKGVKILEVEGDLLVEQRCGLTQEDLLGIIDGYDALIVRSGTQVTRELIEKGSRLKAIGRAGTGVDNVDIEAASERGIVVMNAPFGNTITTAEHTLSLLLSLAREIPQAYASLREGRWERKKFMGVELGGKILGIVGLGRIGKEIARRARGLAMEVLAADPYISLQDTEVQGLKLVELDELYAKADFITVHVPLGEKTWHLISEEAFAKMKPGVRIINCARGGIVDEQALYQAIKSGQVAGAALDVFEKEPPDKDNPLFSLENIVSTPHLGASTKEAQENVAVEIAHQVVQFLKKGIVVNAVNAPSLSYETLTVLSPYLELAEKLGKLIGQLTEGVPISSLSVSYAGVIPKTHSRPLTLSVVQALLAVREKRPVNIVNAPILARKLGLTLEENRLAEAGDYTNLILVQLNTSEGGRQVAGTLIGGKQPRIIQVDDFRLDVIPTGHILIFFNSDQPGIIGNIGNMLGENGINIAGMQFGRDKPGGRAISIFRIDSEVPEPALIKLGKLPHINRVMAVYL